MLTAGVDMTPFVRRHVKSQNTNRKLRIKSEHAKLVIVINH